MSPQGQHIELGIAENNLFLQLAALGLAGPLFGARLLPIGTLYDPFIKRGLDALNYGLYQDARFILVATPSGITLAPEGGAHQSVVEPLIGLGQPGLTAFEPAYADELAVLLRWALEEIQREDGEFGLFPALDPAGRAARAPDRRGARRRHRRRGVLAARAGSRGRAGDRLLRRGGARGACRARGDRAKTCRRRAAGGHLARPAAPRLAEALAHADEPGIAETAAGAAAAGRRAGHGRRQPSRDAVVARRGRAATRSSRSASTSSANRATSPTSTATTASTATRSSTPRRAPACGRRAERPDCDRCGRAGLRRRFLVDRRRPASMPAGGWRSNTLRYSAGSTSSRAAMPPRPCFRRRIAAQHQRVVAGDDVAAAM